MAVQQPHGRSRRTRSSPNRCDASACLFRSLQTIQKERPARRRSCKFCSNWGWADGRNVRIDTRWAGAKADDIHKHAAELAALAPDVILAHGTSTVRPLLQATRTVPIVFVNVIDPVGAAIVDSLSANRAAMPPDLFSSNTASAGNGWSC